MQGGKSESSGVHASLVLQVSELRLKYALLKSRFFSLVISSVNHQSIEDLNFLLQLVEKTH